MIHYDSLLQNATDIITKCNSYFIRKCDATEIYYKMRQVFYYKMRQFYYKMRQLLQNATAITKCKVYCKLRQYTEQFNLLKMEEDSCNNVQENLKLAMKKEG